MYISVRLNLHPLDDDLDRDDGPQLRSMRSVNIRICSNDDGEAGIDTVDGMVNMLEWPCCVHQWK